GGPVDSTTSHPETPAPSPGAGRSAGSGGRAALFSDILRVGAGDPLLGPLPAHALARLANRLAADLGRADALGTAHRGGPRHGPQAARLAEHARAALQQRPSLLGPLASERLRAHPMGSRGAGREAGSP